MAPLNDFLDLFHIVATAEIDGFSRRGDLHHRHRGRNGCRRHAVGIPMFVAMVLGRAYGVGVRFFRMVVIVAMVIATVAVVMAVIMPVVAMVMIVMIVAIMVMVVVMVVMAIAAGGFDRMIRDLIVPLRGIFAILLRLAGFVTLGAVRLGRFGLRSGFGTSRRLGTFAVLR